MRGNILWKANIPQRHLSTKPVQDFRKPKHGVSENYMYVSRVLHMHLIYKSMPLNKHP